MWLVSWNWLETGTIVETNLLLLILIMPKRLTEEEKIARYDQRIEKQMMRNKVWQADNKDKYLSLMAGYSRNYYELHKAERNQKRTEYNRRKREEKKKLEQMAEIEEEIP